jgi:hypothetical protein
MRAATLSWLVIVGSFVFWLFGIERGIGHLAHLGGGIAGFLICRLFLAFGLVRPPPIYPMISDRAGGGEGLKGDRIAGSERLR